jgi:hypothetical protein
MTSLMYQIIISITRIHVENKNIGKKIESF